MKVGTRAKSIFLLSARSLAELFFTVKFSFLFKIMGVELGAVGEMSARK